MSENNKQYSRELASKILGRVFDDCAPKPDGSTRGLQTAVAETIYTGLQIAEKRGEIIAKLRMQAERKAWELCAKQRDKYERRTRELLKALEDLITKVRNGESKNVLRMQCDIGDEVIVRVLYPKKKKGGE